MDSTKIKCLNHPCAQIKIKDGFFVIPEKYHKLFVEDLEVDFIPATQKNWKRLQAIYVSAF